MGNCCKKKKEAIELESENLIENSVDINNELRPETEEEKALRLKKIKEYKEKLESNKNNPLPEPPIVVTKEEYEETKQIDYEKIETLDYREQCEIIGDTLQKQIAYEKENCPEKFIEITNEEKNNMNSPNFALGILQESLQDCGIETVVQKEEEDPKMTQKVLDMIVSGAATQKKYEFHYDFSPQKNHEILNDPAKKEEYINNMIKKYSELLKIPENDIKIFGFKRGSVINGVDFKRVLTNEEKELLRTCDPELMEIKGKLILSACKLTPNMLDPRGDNKDGGWAPRNAEQRGGFPYDPPHTYKGYGLKVLGKYDGGNDTWLGYKGCPGEYAVAYHGVGYGNPQALGLVGVIANSQFLPGQRQAYQNYNDARHPGNKVGVGVYLTPKISVAEGYASRTAGLNGRKYYPVFMCRVKPDKIRYAAERPDYWVLDPQYIRPYRVLIKEH